MAAGPDRCAYGRCRENALLLIGKAISRADTVYAEAGYLNSKPVRFITSNAGAAAAFRAHCGPDTHSEDEAVGLIFSDEVEKFKNALIADPERKVIGLTALDLDAAEQALAEL